VSAWLRTVLHLVILAASLCGCAHADRGRYGVGKVSVVGAKAVDDEALKACLITRERDNFELRLGLSRPTCGKPPFDSSAPTLRLWRWPWTEWPAFNEAIFDQDLQRVLRFYRARGYYDAKVKQVSVEPPEARQPGKHGACDPAHDTCPVALLVRVDEGPPTRVNELLIQGLDQVAVALREQALTAVPLRKGDVIDEASYERGKAELTQRLRSAGHAGVAVVGSVQIDTQQRTARVRYDVTPGPRYRWGKLRIKNHGALSAPIIEKAAGLKAGKEYDPEDLVDAQAEVMAMGGFSAVQVNEKLNPDERTVDVELEVTPLSPHALRLAVGVMSGAIQRTATSELASIPQWDVHLLARYERRHPFGSLLIARIEDRPRLIFDKDFPRPTKPQPGNLIKLSLTQPGLLEARTESFFETAWDYGPEPFLSFIRSDVLMRVGSRRGFFRRRLGVTLALQQDLFVVGKGADNVSSDGQPQSSYAYSFVEQDLRLDLRNNRIRPERGLYLGLNTTQALRWRGSDWTAFRVSPEARSFVPLFWDIVWATRVGLSSVFITSASEHLDALAARLGPATYRLRGGGANGNRGFLAGQLGSGLTGGIRRWDASTELRLPLGESFVLAGFFDLGNVSDTSSFRFDHLNASVGHGFRYYTVLGAIRLDVGYRLASLQRSDGSPGIEPEAERLPGINVPGAIHLTIGDAF
jgi:translocation and assembly module TamA